MAPVASAPRSGIDYSKFDAIVDSDDEKPDASASSPEKPAVADKPHCHNCHKDITKPLRCGVCKKAEYCSAQCQREDWKYHKRTCKKPEEPKAKEPEKKSPASAAPAKKREEEKVVDDGDENITWYRHREWKPTAEPKKEFKPVAISADQASAEEAAKPAAAGSAWNAAGTWEEKDVTELARRTLKEKLAGFRRMETAGGELSAEAVDAVEGEASKPVIRGKMRHMFDLSFKVKFAFRWMDGSGQRKAEGTIEVADFTNDAFVEGAAAPEVRLAFADARLLDDGRRRAVEASIGVGAWPPAPDTLMQLVYARLLAWSEEYQQVS